MNITDASLFNFLCEYRKSKDNLAVSQGYRAVSFVKFEKLVKDLAGRFVAAGIKKGDVIAISLPNIIQNVISVYAASLIGAVVYELHPKIGTEHFKKEIELIKPKIVLLSEINYTKLKGYALNTKIVYCPYGAYGFIGLTLKKADISNIEVKGEDRAIIMHSGGTSGEQKTLVLSHATLNSMAYNLLNSLDNKFNGEDTMLTAIPLFHGFGLGVGVHAGLCGNMKVALLPAFTAKKAVNIIKNNKSNVVIAIPRLLEKILKEDAFSSVAGNVKDFFIGGDSVDATLIQRANKVLTNTRVSVGYGLSETSSVCTLQRDEFIDDSIGKPLLNVDIKIVDENHKDVKKGDIGELLISSAQNMIGYITQTGIDKSSFITIDNKEYVKTGDLVKEDENHNLFFMGRAKRLIKISGINVFPTEIERVVKESGIVNDCVAFRDEMNGKVCISLATEKELSQKEIETIQSIVRDKLSKWSVPTKFVKVDSITVTELGKTKI